jgi:hypothetical protein
MVGGLPGKWRAKMTFWSILVLREYSAFISAALHTNPHLSGHTSPHRT